MSAPGSPQYLTNAPPTAGAIHRHPHFYFEDGDIIILVETVLYRLHRSTLSRYSNVFLDTLGLHQGEGSEKGKNDENPIPLSSVTSAEFDRLLWLEYPR
jgi:hypothetical protein